MKPYIRAKIRKRLCQILEACHRDHPKEDVEIALDCEWFSAVVTIKPHDVEHERRATINMLLLSMLEQDPNRVDWSVRQWAEELGCSIGTVARTAAWKRIQAAREVSKRGRTRDEDS